MSHLENNYIFGILASSWLIWLIWKWHSSTFNFWPLITLWGNFDAPYLKLLNDASVASACFYVRTCRRVRNSKKIATIRDFHLPGSFLCLSTRLNRPHSLVFNKCQIALLKLFMQVCILYLTVYIFTRFWCDENCTQNHFILGVWWCYHTRMPQKTGPVYITNLLN